MTIWEKYVTYLARNMSYILIASSVNETAVEVNVFYAMVLPVISLLATFLNVAIIYAFWKLPKLCQRPSELLVLNLSCSDLMTGLLVIPLGSPLFITPHSWPFGKVGCQILVLFLNMSLPASLFALISISMDRFLLVYMAYPKYVKLQSKIRIHFNIAACWIISTLSVIIELSVWNYAEEDIKDILVIDYSEFCLSPPRRLKSFTTTYFILLYFLPIILVCTLSIAFLYHLNKRLIRSKTICQAGVIPTSTDEEMYSMTPVPPTESQQQLHHTHSPLFKKRYIRPAATLVSLVSAMAICMLPYCIYVLAMDFFCAKCPLNTDTLYALLLLQFCNAVLDPILYGITNRKIRKFHKKCLKSKLVCLKH